MRDGRAGSPPLLMRAGVGEVSGDRWFARSDFPPEMRESLSRRLGVLGLLTAAAFVFLAVLFYPLGRQTGNMWLLYLAAVCNPGAIALSVLLFVLARRYKDNVKTLVRMGIVYEIAIAVLIGLLDSSATGGELIGARGWSGVAA